MKISTSGQSPSSSADNISLTLKQKKDRSITLEGSHQHEISKDERIQLEARGANGVDGKVGRNGARGRDGSDGIDASRFFPGFDGAHGGQGGHGEADPMVQMQGLEGILKYTLMPLIQYS